MKSKHIALFICALVLGAAPLLIAAPSCDVTAKIPAAARTFAKTNNQDHWHEYRGIGNVPSLDTNGGASAQYWLQEGGASSVHFVEPGEDYWTYTRYCFDSAGRLGRVGFEIRTAWGWGFRLEGSVYAGVVHANSSQYFNTESHTAIQEPRGADDIPNALKPMLYMKESELSFAALLSLPREPASK